MSLAGQVAVRSMGIGIVVIIIVIFLLIVMIIIVIFLLIVMIVIAIRNCHHQERGWASKYLSIPEEGDRDSS